MHVEGLHAPELIGIAAAEKADRLRRGAVHRVVAVEGLEVEGELVGIHERPDEPPSWNRWMPCGGA
jgi:hypothetical protein